VPLIESEEAIIGRLGELFRNSFAPRLEVGIGDDAAVISGIDNKLVATVDMAVEGIHFRTSRVKDRSEHEALAQ